MHELLDAFLETHRLSIRPDLLQAVDLTVTQQTIFHSLEGEREAA
jgi:hypothetical protein